MLNEQIEELRSDIALYDRTIKRKKDDHNSVYMKAVACVKLFELTKDESYSQKALESFTSAIRLTESKYPLYLAERAKFYSKIGNNELAVEDMSNLSKLPKTAGGGIEDIYTRNTVNNIAKLDNIQNVINTLKVKGKISPELADALNEHAKITSQLVVQVDEHNSKLNDHGDRIVFLENVIKELQVGASLSAEKMQILSNDNASLKRVVEEHDLTLKKHEAEISAIKNQLEEFAVSFELTNEQLESLSKDLEEYGVNAERLMEVMPLVGSIKELVKSHEENKLHEEVLEGIMSDPYKASFYNTIIQNLNTTYLASSVIRTDMVENNKLGFLGNVGNVLQATGGYVPVFGAGVQILGYVLNVVDEYKQRQFIENYCKLANDVSHMEEISSKLGIILAGDNFDKSVLDRPETTKQKLEFFLKHGLGILSDAASASEAGNLGLGQKVVKMSEKLVDKARDILPKFSFWRRDNDKKLEDNKSDSFNQSESSEIETVFDLEKSAANLGSKHGDIVSSFLVATIFKGNTQSELVSYDVEGRVDILLKDICIHFDVDSSLLLCSSHHMSTKTEDNTEQKLVEVHDGLLNADADLDVPCDLLGNI